MSQIGSTLAKTAEVEVENGRGEVKIAGTANLDGASPEGLRAGARAVAAHAKIAIDGVTVAHQDVALTVEGGGSERWEFERRSSRAQAIRNFEMRWGRSRLTVAPAAGRFSIEALFDGKMLGPKAHRVIEIELTMGNAIIARGSATIPITTGHEGDHAERGEH